MGNDYEAFVGKLETAAVSFGSTSGPYEIVAESASAGIRVYGYNIKCRSAAVANFQAISTGSTLTGAIPVDAYDELREPVSPYSPFRDLVAGEGLWLDFSAVNEGGGWVRYRRLS